MASLKRRGKTGTYYAQWYDEFGKQVRKSLETTVLQVAKHRLCDLLDDSPRVAAFTTTRTPITDIVPAYIANIRARLADTTQRSHLWVLGDLFGPICEDLKTPDGRSRGRAKRKFVALPPLCIKYLEDLSRAEVADFIAARVTKRGGGPKTANRYREIMLALVNWAIDEREVMMPRCANPIQKLKKNLNPNIRSVTSNPNRSPSKWSPWKQSPFSRRW